MTPRARVSASPVAACGSRARAEPRPRARAVARGLLDRFDDVAGSRRVEPRDSARRPSTRRPRRERRLQEGSTGARQWECFPCAIRGKPAAMYASPRTGEASGAVLAPRDRGLERGLARATLRALGPSCRSSRLPCSVWWCSMPSPSAFGELLVHVLLPFHGLGGQDERVNAWLAAHRDSTLERRRPTSAR